MTLHQEEKFSTTLDQAMSGQRPDSLNTNGHPVSDISVDANSISGNGITSKLAEAGDCSCRKPDVTKIGSNDERTGCRKLSDCPCGRPRRHYSVFSLYTTSSFLLSFVDNLVFNGLVIGPLTVSFWRGVWVMLDEQLFPSDGAASGWTCVAVGNTGLLIVFYVSGKLKQKLQWPRHRGRVRRFADWHWLLGYHLFSYVVGVLNVCHWRGLWILLDHYTGINSPSAWISFAIGQVGLWLLRSSKNALASPMSINMDTGKDFFDYTTRFSVNRRKREHFFLDAFLTVFVVHQFVALYWRGLWEALDVHLAPDNDSLSAGVSILAAFVLHVTVCFLEPVLNALFRLNRVRLIPNRTKSDTMSSLSAGVKSSQGLLPPDSSAAAADTAAADSIATNSTKLHRWLLETFFYFIANAVSVLHWRGFWLLLDVYLLPEQKTLSAFISHLVGIVCLWLLLAGNSVALIGCNVDGNSPSQDGCTIPNQYIRYFIRCRQTRIRKAKLVQSQRLDVCGTYPHQLRREKTNGAAIKAEGGDVDVLRAMLTAAFSRSSATEVDCPVVVCSEVELVKDKETANGKYSSAINNNIDIETDHNHEDTARKKRISTNDDDDVKRAADDAVISDCRQLLENSAYADFAGLVETFI